MADRGSSGHAGCHASCGCPYPCPGGKDCRCAQSQTSSGGHGHHNRCSCGHHCGCNPCYCNREEVAGVGKGHCKCEHGCTCVTCTS